MITLVNIVALLCALTVVQFALILWLFRRWMECGKALIALGEVVELQTKTNSAFRNAHARIAYWQLRVVELLKAMNAQG